MKRLAIFNGVLGVFLFTLAVAPAYAGTNTSNTTGTNTSNSTGTNTSNNPGKNDPPKIDTNTSNNSGNNASNNQGYNSGYNSQIIEKAQQILTKLRAALTSGNQQQIEVALAEAEIFLQQRIRSRQGW